jgi:toxin ParE1/3/4
VIVIWSDEAIGDLASLRARISKDSPLSARRAASMIVDSVETLIPANPKIGRPGRISGTRELVIPHTPYIVPYRLHDGAVNILRVYHGARRWPP